ncbi:Ribosomal protein L10 [Candidatus Liberibacter americanus str. Sao Paulo]|uniref:Large ribosomal subunit protein uL10 n=2 Tax=Candidatus Liberibacter americanus TaxID=309868 RepID=U6B5C0_9HYPH|nr:Ribosomal protein L10 [Candidatus Liberibacter americanus str. Sao Paulo]
MKEAGGFAKVVKNRLVKVAIKDTDFQGMSDFFSGQSLIVCSKDPVAAPQISVDFAKENDQFKIIGGILDKGILDNDAIKEIASLPSIDVLRARILGCIQHNSVRLLRTLNAPHARFFHIISACMEENKQD